MTLVVNLLGAPGSGKSTLAARLYSELSSKGHSVELVTEVAKDLLFDNRHDILKYQHLVFGLQHQKLDRLVGKVDYIITDSPLLLSKFYNEDKSPDYPQSALDELVTAMWNRYNNFTIFLQREHEFRQEGRYHVEAQCIEAEWSLRRRFEEDIDLSIGTRNIAIEELITLIHTTRRNRL